jgi:type I restriction enzyme S subunit
MEAIGEDGSLDLHRRRLSDVEVGYTYFRDNDVTVAKITPCFENGKGAIMRGLVGGIGFGTTELIVARPDLAQTTSEYLNWLFRSAPFRILGEACMYGAGGQKRVPDDFVRDFAIAFPPLPEQVAIASFLDHETGKIDALAEEQRRLIELLKEKRQAVISHAITKGFDATALMKESDVEWLGKVPSHWEVVPLRWLFRFVKRQEDAKLEVLSVYRDFGVIEKSSRNDNNNTTPEDLSKYQTVRVGDLVVNKMKAWQGSVGVSTHDGITSPDYAVFEPKHGGSDRYFNWLLRCRLLPNVYLSISNGIRNDQWRLEPDKLKAVRLPLPPVAEQAAIADAIQGRVASFDGLIAGAEAAITLLKERRAALISAAVTGKIDVRGIEHGKTGIDRARLRLVVSAAVIEAVADRSNSGRTKHHKILYLAEAHIGIDELQGSFLREAAGPLDRALLDGVESQLRNLGHIAVDQPSGPGTQVTYRVTGRRGTFRNELSTALGHREADFNRLVSDLKDLNTHSVEAIATLFAVWNDSLIDGEYPDDDRIVSMFLTEWHPEKGEKFKARELHTWLGWMRRHNIVPEGRGPRTITGRLFV